MGWGLGPARPEEGHAGGWMGGLEAGSPVSVQTGEDALLRVSSQGATCKQLVRKTSSGPEAGSRG